MQMHRQHGIVKCGSTLPRLPSLNRMVARSAKETPSHAPQAQATSFPALGQLYTEGLLSRYETMVEEGMSKGAAKACLASTEFVASGPLLKVSAQLDKLDADFLALEFRVGLLTSVLIAVTVAFIGFVDVDKLPNAFFSVLIKRLG